MVERRTRLSLTSVFPSLDEGGVGRLFSFGARYRADDGRSVSESTGESSGRIYRTAASSGFRRIVSDDSSRCSSCIREGERGRLCSGGIAGKSCSAPVLCLCSLALWADRDEPSRDMAAAEGVPALNFCSMILVLTCLERFVEHGLRRLAPLSLLLLAARSLPLITSATGIGCIIHITSSRLSTLVTVGGCISLIAGLRVA